jgi:predicted DNA-binding transcriptional regulator AlpA
METVNPSQAHRSAVSIREFCDRHGFSIASYYNLKKLGKSPREMHVGKRVLISDEAGADWRRAMEAETAA